MWILSLHTTVGPYEEDDKSVGGITGGKSSRLIATEFTALHVVTLPAYWILVHYLLILGEDRARSVGSAVEPSGRVDICGAQRAHDSL